MPHLMTNQGTKVTSSGEMAEVFCDRGFTTYAPHTNSQTVMLEAAREYMQSLCMPTLLDLIRKEIESPITVEELGVAVAQTKPLKAPTPMAFLWRTAQLF